ncbi:MAG: hypothetical protein AAGC60_05775 [Acidobacteriota bacterium]
MAARAAGTLTSLVAFVTPHGFGHAARTAALLVAVRRQRADRGLPALDLHVVSSVPRWFFVQSGLEPFTHHDEVTDVGLVQRTALREDLDASVAALERFDPFDGARLAHWTALLERVGCDLVFCDIAPAGLLAAHRAGLPSVLLESFTWPWIYRGTGDERLERWADRLDPVIELADLYLQTAPACEHRTSALQVGPIARTPRHGGARTRERLGLGSDDGLVLVTMGGVPWEFGALREPLAQALTASGPNGRRRWLVIAGAADTPTTIELGHRGGAVLLPHRSEFEHPDLVAAADAVCAKLGYSTIAEIAHCGTRFGYVPRPAFRESAVLEAWAREHLATQRIDPEILEAADARWLEAALELLEIPTRPPLAGGTEAAARAVDGLLTG